MLYVVVRVYVMGDCCFDVYVIVEDIVCMVEVVCGGIGVGVFGLFMNCMFVYRVIDGFIVFGINVEYDEIVVVVLVLGELGWGVLELVFVGVMGDDFNVPRREVGWMRRVVEVMGCFVFYVLV